MMDWWGNIYEATIFHIDQIIDDIENPKQKEGLGLVKISNYVSIPDHSTGFLKSGLEMLYLIKKIGTDKNLALLNMKHEDELIRYYCRKVLKNDT